MQKMILVWLLLTPWALAQPALEAAEQTLKFPLTRTQAQTLGKLSGSAFDQEVRRLGRRGHNKLVGALDQQAVDAVSEWFLFAVAVVDGQTPSELPPGGNYAAHLQQILVRGWPNLSSDNQKKVLDFPVYWASVRHNWPELTQEQQQALVSNWRAALGPLLHSSQRQELARACLADLQTTYRNQAATPLEINQALQRLESAARRMAADADPESKALSRQLQSAMLAVQAQQDRTRALQEIEAQKARLSAPASADYNRVFRQINQANVSRYRVGH